MDPEQAYRALVEFLEMQWAQHPVPGDFGDFYGYCGYTPGLGTTDPAMWGDWLAAVKKLQTGVDVPDPDRDALTQEALAPIVPEQAYLAMFEFIKEYWERVSRPAEIGDLLGQMLHTPGVGTADPEIGKVVPRRAREVPPPSRHRGRALRRNGVQDLIGFAPR